jgi:Uma2 family endonuclease
MTGTAKFIPIEVYLRTSYRPDVDYVDGVIEERNLGQNDHSAWQLAICRWFQQQAQTSKVRVLPELRIRVGGTRVRIPNGALLDRSLPTEQVPTVPPIAVFEVVSPDDQLAKLASRCLDYERMGIHTIHVLDPEGDAYRFTAGRMQPLEARAFDIPGCGARFNLDEIRGLVD